MQKTTAQQIKARIHGRGRGAIFGPKDFLDLASHETARQTLLRLMEEGMIRRLKRGIYEYPQMSALFKAPAKPDPNEVAKTIARTHGWTILPSGDTALNMLGLSTQVPAQWQYFSDGPSKTYEWEGGTLRFKHRAIKETSNLSPSTALLVQALKALGKKRVDRSITEKIMAKMSEKDLARATHEAQYATSWVYEIIKAMAAERKGHHA